MNWLDIVIGLLIAAGVAFGLARGLGKTAFDAVCLYAALAAAAALAPTLAAHANFRAGGAGLNESWALGLLFLGFSVIGLGISWYANSMTQWNAGMFDKLLGLAAGAALGIIVAHTLVSVQVMASGEAPQEASASLGTVSDEMYEFPTYHSVMNLITGAGTYRRELPNVNGK